MERHGVLLPDLGVPLSLTELLLRERRRLPLADEPQMFADHSFVLFGCLVMRLSQEASAGDPIKQRWDRITACAGPFGLMPLLISASRLAASLPSQCSIIHRSWVWSEAVKPGAAHGPVQQLVTPSTGRRTDRPMLRPFGRHLGRVETGRSSILIPLTMKIIVIRLCKSRSFFSMSVPVDRKHHPNKEKSNRHNGNPYNHHAWGNTYCCFARCASGGTARQTSKSE